LGDRWQTRATSGGNPPGAGYSGTRGSSGRIREGRCFEEGFRRDSRQGFGVISRFRKSLSAQPSGHMARSEGRTEGFGSKACRKGLSKKWLLGQVALSEGRSGGGFGGSFEKRPS